MQNIKFYIGIIVLAIITILSVIIVEQHKKIKQVENNLSTAVINLKAYESENDSLINKNIEYNYTIDQLNSSSDSLVRELNNLRKTLKIKDKNIAELQYIASHTSKVDSIFVRDTIFKDVDFYLDTTISDK
jgi:type II secretory pathway pseudopilin PulG